MDLSQALPTVPEHIRRRLLFEYAALQDAYSGSPGDWSATLLHTALLCELVIHVVDPTFAPSPTPEREVLSEVRVDEWCRAADSGKRAGPGVSVTLGRTIRATYALRNKRGGSHASGEVAGNRMDATLAVAASRWVLAEVIRHQTGLSTGDAQSFVEQLADRDAEGAFARILGHRFSLYNNCRPLQRPHHLADRDALAALGSMPDLGMLDDTRLGYLYASAVHQDFAVDYWHAFTRPTVAALASLAWLATFDDYVSAIRAKQQLQRFPSPVRDAAAGLAGAELNAVDHPAPAAEDAAAALLGDVAALRATIETLPQNAPETHELLGSGETRELVQDLKTLLPATDVVTVARLGLGRYLDSTTAGFVFALCVYLRHRDTDLWRSVDGHSEACAAWLADMVSAQTRAARFRAAAELALYPKKVRFLATTSARRSEDTATQQLVEAIRQGRDAMLALVVRGHPALGNRKAEVESWVLARYADARKEDEDT